MNNMIMDNMDVVYYVIKVNGVEVSAKFSSKIIAETEVNNLPDDQKFIAEIVPVTTDGKQILLG